MLKNLLTILNNIYEKHPPENRYRINLHQHNKSIYDKTAANIILSVKKLKVFQDQKQDKGAHSRHYFF